MQSAYIHSLTGTYTAYTCDKYKKAAEAALRVDKVPYRHFIEVHRASWRSVSCFAGSLSRQLTLQGVILRRTRRRKMTD